MATVKKTTASTKATSTSSAKTAPKTTQTTKVAATKPAATTKHIADQISAFPKRRVWPD